MGPLYNVVRPQNNKKPRDKNLAATNSNSKQRFYQSSDFDSITHTTSIFIF